MLAISVDKNTNYGPPLVTNKYRPLENIDYVPADKVLYSSLLTSRWQLFQNSNLLPAPLVLRTLDWKRVIAQENRANQQSPLVVVSSNRSKWISDGIKALKASGLTLHNISDLRALAQVSGGSSPPVYCPARLGAEARRNVYVIVHITEYSTYRENLSGTGITVICWNFDINNTAPGVTMVGFGASRYAAIEFCKHLRTASAMRWNDAWLFDDNVVALTGFAGMDAVENRMGNNIVAAGFHGGVSAEAQASNQQWAKREIAAGRGTQVQNLPPSNPPGILQQAVLWNIAYLSANHLNFGPAYIASAEDLSLGSYFDVQKIGYHYYPGIGVRKEVTTYDDSTGASQLKQYKQNLNALMVRVENNAPTEASPPPPPIWVKPVEKADGDEQTLEDFIVKRVLPYSTLSNKAEDEATKNTATCQGSEQITSGAIKKNYVSPAALDSTFKINGNNAQIVVQLHI